MSSYPPPQNSSYIAKLQQKYRQLLIKLGTTSKQQQKKSIYQYINKRQKLIKYLKIFQQNLYLQKQQQQMTLLLIETQQLLQQLQTQQKQLNQQSQYLTQQKVISLSIINKISQQLSFSYENKKLTKQLTNITQIINNINQKQIINNINCLNYVKINIVNNKKQVNQIRQSQCQQLSQLKHLYQELYRQQQQLRNQLSARKITLTQIRNKKQQIPLPILQYPSNPQQQLNQSNNFKINKHTVEKSSLILKKKIALKYHIWALILFIWLILLLSFQMNNRQIHNKSYRI